MGLAQHRSTLGVGEQTARDRARRAEREALALHWARVDAQIADALGETEEHTDGTS